MVLGVMARIPAQDIVSAQGYRGFNLLDNKDKPV